MTQLAREPPQHRRAKVQGRSGLAVTRGVMEGIGGHETSMHPHLSWASFGDETPWLQPSAPHRHRGKSTRP